MTTTTERNTALAAATVPYALSGLAWHLLDYRLPTPEQIEIRDGRLTLYVLSQDVEAWNVTSDFAAEKVETRTDRAYGTGPFDVHRVDAVLHGAGVKVTICWTTVSDVAFCEGDDCSIHTGQPAFEPGCLHGSRTLCAEHRSDCAECVDDARQDSAAGGAL